MGSSTFATEYAMLQRVTGDSGTTNLVTLKQNLNDANKILNAAWDWPWLKYRGVVDLVAAYSTGTVTIVDDTTDYMTTTGTWSTAWSPVRVRTAAGHDYLLTYNAGNTRWEMDRNLVTAESAVTYLLYKDTYGLPVRLRSLYLGWETITNQFPLDIISESQIQALRGGPIRTAAVPEALSLVEPDATTLVSQLMVNPIPSAARSIHYRGFRDVADLSADADIFQFPIHVVPVFRRLARSLAFEWRGALDRANDERAKYELDVKRLIEQSDPTAHVQDGIELSTTHFRPKPPPDGEYGYDIYG